MADFIKMAEERMSKTNKVKNTKAPVNRLPSYTDQNIPVSHTFLNNLVGLEIQRIFEDEPVLIS